MVVVDFAVRSVRVDCCVPMPSRKGVAQECGSAMTLDIEETTVDYTNVGVQVDEKYWPELAHDGRAGMCGTLDLWHRELLRNASGLEMRQFLMLALIVSKSHVRILTKHSESHRPGVIASDISLTGAGHSCWYLAGKVLANPTGSASHPLLAMFEKDGVVANWIADVAVMEGAGAKSLTYRDVALMVVETTKYRWSGKHLNSTLSEDDFFANIQRLMQLCTHPGIDPT